MWLQITLAVVSLLLLLAGGWLIRLKKEVSSLLRETGELIDTFGAAIEDSSISPEEAAKLSTEFADVVREGKDVVSVVAELLRSFVRVRRGPASYAPKSR